MAQDRLVKRSPECIEGHEQIPNWLTSIQILRHSASQAIKF